MVTEYGLPGVTPIGVKRTSCRARSRSPSHAAPAATARAIHAGAPAAIRACPA